MNKTDKIIRARIALMRSHPFFGRLCLLLSLKEEEDAGTMGTDGEHLYYNPAFVESMTESQIMAVLCHEVLHAALGHIWRRDKRNRHAWNYACDYAINPIVQQNRFQLPEGALFDQRYLNMNAETIYDKLPKSEACEICAMMMPNGDDGKEGERQDGEGEGQEGKDGKEGKKPKEGDGKEGKKGKPYSGKHSHHVCQSHGYWKRVEKSKNVKKVQERWEAAVAESITRDRGRVPAGFEHIIEEMTPKEDWRKILNNFLSVSSSDFDFFKRDRRTLDTPFYIPDLSSEEKLEDVVVAIDTSGSISNTELNQFVSEVKKILKLFPQTNGWLIECDAAVGEVIELQKAKDKSRFSGRGGTSHKPVFAEIEKRKMRPKVLLAFTDLWTDFPSKHPDYPVLWLNTPGGSDQKPPFGRVIQLREHIK